MIGTRKIYDQNNLWIVLLIVIFGLVYIQSMTFVYVEGDDATSMAYHIMGRNKDIQSAYTPYQGMMDKMLGFLPSNEVLLRFTSLFATNLAAILMVMLILMLVFDWTRRQNITHPKWLITISVLLAAPEMFFLGLVYSPTLIAMCLLLAAHLILRYASRNANWLKFNDKKQIAYIVVSLFLFGFGVSFRWNTAIYAVVIIVDLILLQPDAPTPLSTPLKKRIGLGVLWGGLALTFSILMISISGYGFSDFIKKFETVLFVINQSGVKSTDSSTSMKEVLMYSVLPLSPMFTPAFGLLTLLGFIEFARRRNPLTLVILVGFLGILPWLKSGVPKFIITALPVFILCFMQGFTMLWNRVGQGWVKQAANLTLILLLLAPWILGLRVTREGTAYGPGFELRSYDYPDTEGMQFDVTLGAGAAFPTPEGPRSLFGYGFVLIGGDWRKFVLEEDAERNEAIQYALSLGYPIVVTNWSPDYFLNKLYSMGFKTNDSNNNEQYFTKRYFINSQRESVTIVIHGTEESDADELVGRLSDPTMNSNKVIITGYPSVMRFLFTHYPEAMESIGSISAILDINKLH